MATDNKDPPKSSATPSPPKPADPPPNPAPPPHPAPPADPPATAAAKAGEGKEPEKAKEPEEKVLKHEDAKALFHGGHRLKKKGDKGENWIAATKVRGVLCLAIPLTEEVEKHLFDGDLVLLPE